MSLWFAIAAGGAAGAVHVLSGPDHLTAVLPFALGDRARALRIGLSWGFGHGVGVAVLGLVALVLRSRVQVETFSSFAEGLVGLFLVLVGFWSLRQSRKVVIHTHAHAHEPPTPVHAKAGRGRFVRRRPIVARLGSTEHAHPHVHVPGLRGHPHSVLAFGVLHGFAGAGHLFGVLPSLALGRAAALAYLISFLGGGMVAMSLFALGMVQLARREAWVPRAMAGAGLASIAVGAFWIVSMTEGLNIG